MRVKGKVVSWNDDKGYGFLTPLEGGETTFVHITAFKNRNRRPDVDDVVSYAITKDERGRLRAINAILGSDTLPGKRVARGLIPAVILAGLFFAALGRSVYVGDLPDLILIVYSAASIVTFLAYALDKYAARTARWRTPERILHLLALIGGWPGALIAQQTLRHKSRKVRFRVVFWLTVLLNCASLVWLHTSDGQARLQQVFGATGDALTLPGQARWTEAGPKSFTL